MSSPPLVSVVIPCYNQANYLAEAVNSVLGQTYANTEIIIVNDGSTDHTSEVATHFSKSTYIEQTNMGLSAARNAGLKVSQGEFVLFLDSDDVLLPKAIETNLKLLLQWPKAAFVSGGHQKTDVYLAKILETVQKPILGHHYSNLLQENYIGMHAAVLYRKPCLKNTQFNTKLTACEDYELYLKLSRKYPVVHHTEVITLYRQHNQNMSGRPDYMLRTVLMVLEQEKEHLKNDCEIEAFHLGKQNWIQYYSNLIVEQLLYRADLSTVIYNEYILTLNQLAPSQLKRYYKRRRNMQIKKILKPIIPGFITRRYHRFKYMAPAVGHTKPKNFTSLKPLSREFGYDRGGPVDRYYIENFLKANSQNIKGKVLEIGDNGYTLLFGGNSIEQSDILHVDDKNTQATIIGDLAHAPMIEDNTFDCIILTQTLHLIYNFEGAIKTCYRILKPGGSLLLTSPGITPLDHGEWKKTWYWSFTQFSLERLFQENFLGQRNIQVYGNVRVASAFLYGAGLSELTTKELDYPDPHYPVILTVHAQKLAIDA